MKIPTRFPGISRHARALGISRPHLYRILTGECHNSEMLSRYRSLAALDPDGIGTVKIVFLPQGTRFAGCQLPAPGEVKKTFGNLVKIEAGGLVLCCDCTLSVTAEQTTIRPADTTPATRLIEAPRPT